MKKLLFAMTTLLSLNSFASGYPGDYCQQRVYPINNGPALLARIGSGCTDLLVIGYKNSGILAKAQYQEIDAVVTGTCSISSNVKVTVIKLGKEWNGTGYMNNPEYATSVYPSECYGDRYKKLAVAFSDGKGNWDSRYGENYVATLEDFYNAGYILSKNYGPYPGLDTWKIIINEMKK